MTALNADAAELVRPLRPHAVTDVTGFGLLGHAHELAVRSGVAIELDANALPALPGALELAAEGVRTGGDRRNREFVGDSLAVDGASEAQVALAFDPQTSGGLLVAVPPGALDGRAAPVGRVLSGSGVRLVA
jgi:selenide,water dikinase